MVLFSTVLAVDCTSFSTLFLCSSSTLSGEVRSQYCDEVSLSFSAFHASYSAWIASLGWTWHSDTSLSVSWSSLMAEHSS